MRQLILRTKILSNIRLGIYTVTEHYDNGDIETYESPDGPMIFHDLTLGVLLAR